jgi:hypothetical protein
MCEQFFYNVKNWTKEMECLQRICIYTRIGFLQYRIPGEKFLFPSNGDPITVSLRPRFLAFQTKKSFF